MSRHPWYTVSGFISRLLYAVVMSFPGTGSYEFALALMYGAIEEFGLIHSIVLLVRVRRVWARSLVVLRKKRARRQK
jgi:uncharacterized membrane protein HdeD (DUF308 family)